MPGKGDRQGAGPGAATGAGALYLALALALAGCDEAPKPPKPTRERAQAVTAQAGGTATATARPSAATSSAAAPPKRVFCKGQSQRDTPGDITAARAVEGAPSLPPLRYGDGRWLWLSLWAGWCEPCKKEMPLLLRWRDQLRAAGVKIELAFVSIDDDDREMARFMKTQPSSGVRASYWLEEGETRESWFSTIGYDDVPSLPIHVLVEPGGKLACIVEGAVDEADWPGVQAFVRR
jgi:thiol-disulfide isomerase/thioredoxin